MLEAELGSAVSPTLDRAPSVLVIRDRIAPPSELAKRSDDRRVRCFVQGVGRGHGAGVDQHLIRSIAHPLDQSAQNGHP